MVLGLNSCCVLCVGVHRGRCIARDIQRRILSVVTGVTCNYGLSVCSSEGETQRLN